MDNIELLIYLLLIGFGLFSRLLKAKKKKPPPQQGPADVDQEPQGKPVTFEDLLKEFTGETQGPTQQERPVPAEPMATPKAPEPEYQYEDDDIRERYESSVKKASEIKTIDELVDLEDDRHTGQFKHFRGYDEHETEKEESEFIKFLRTEDGPRKAIILSEILNRRY